MYAAFDPSRYSLVRAYLLHNTFYILSFRKFTIDIKSYTGILFVLISKVIWLGLINHTNLIILPCYLDYLVTGSLVKIVLS